MSLAQQALYESHTTQGGAILEKSGSSDQDVLAIVESTPGAVGLVDVRSVNDRVTVIRVDGRVPMEDGYLPH